MQTRLTRRSGWTMESPRMWPIRKTRQGHPSTRERTTFEQRTSEFDFLVNLERRTPKRRRFISIPHICSAMNSRCIRVELGKAYSHPSERMVDELK